MLAFTPIPDALMAVARSESEFTPDPVLNDVCVPSAPVIVRVEVPRLELLLGNDGEYHDALVARLCTDIKCEPSAAPGCGCTGNLSCTRRNCASGERAAYVIEVIEII